MNVSKTNKSSSAAAGSTKRAGTNDAAVGTLSVNDNRNDTFSVFGITGAGDQTDLHDNTTITVQSVSDATVLAASMVDAHTFKVVGLKPGTANVLVRVAFKNGGGTFTITLPVTVGGALATGLVLTAGTPTVA